jgi:hypothetical protein
MRLVSATARIRPRSQLRMNYLSLIWVMCESEMKAKVKFRSLSLSKAISTRLTGRALPF